MTAPGKNEHCLIRGGTVSSYTDDLLSQHYLTLTGFRRGHVGSTRSSSDLSVRNSVTKTVTMTYPIDPARRTLQMLRRRWSGGFRLFNLLI